MKKINLTFFALFISLSLLTLSLYSQSENVGIGVESPQSRLHVSGNIQSDSLSGSTIRVATVNTDGVIKTIDDGNVNEYLQLTPQGPAWKSSNSNNSGNDCPPFSCPTTFSLTSDSQMFFGSCLRYCGTLTEDSFTDWRVPSIDEVLILVPDIAIETPGIWTQTTYIHTTDPSWPGSRRFVTFNLTSGSMTTVDAVNLQYCKCVR